MVKAAPLFEHVKRHIADGIRSGSYGPGAKLPSESALVEAFGVSRMTVNRAFRELSQEGIIYRVQGVGSFVSDPEPKESLLELQDIRDRIEAQGEIHHCRLILTRSEIAAGRTAELFESANGFRLAHVEIVHYAGDLPLQLERRFVRSSFAPAFPDIDFEKQSTFAYLQSIAPVSELEQQVEAALPDAAEQGALDLEPSHPVLRVRRRTWAGSSVAGASVVTLSYFSYPYERYRVVARVTMAPR